jgi:hypothetical protein
MKRGEREEYRRKQSVPARPKRFTSGSSYSDLSLPNSLLISTIYYWYILHSNENKSCRNKRNESKLWRWVINAIFILAPEIKRKLFAILLHIPYFCIVINIKCRSQWPCGLRRGSWPVGCWDRGFESRSRHGRLSASFCVVLSCVGRGLATGW